MRVAYLSQNELEAPLVQSQVLPYLRYLVARGHRFSLLTFEPDRRRFPARLGLEQGIEWHPIHRRRGVPGTLRAMTSATRTLSRLHREQSIDLLHARSYLPAMVIERFARRTNIPWIFDMRGFWVDEKVLKGSLRENGWFYGGLKARERGLLNRASGIVSLTHRALPRIREMAYLDRLPPHAVIPTCTDLERFHPPKRSIAEMPLVFGYVGSLGAGYEGLMVADFLATALERYLGSRALVVTRSDSSKLTERLSGFGGRVEVTSNSYDAMPELVRSMTFGMSFHTPHPSKDATCPTKIGEYLACGVPVISNRGIGDVDDILEKHRVGLFWEAGGDPEGFFTALDALMQQGAELRTRCRACAEDVFSVDEGAARYDALYHELHEAYTRSY